MCMVRVASASFSTLIGPLTRISAVPVNISDKIIPTVPTYGKSLLLFFIIVVVVGRHRAIIIVIIDKCLSLLIDGLPNG